MKIQLLALMISLAAAAPSLADMVIDFNELSGYTDATADGSYLNGYGFGAATGSWSSGGATFGTNQWGPGWSYSNVNNTTTAGYTNQFAAYPGTDVSGNGNYVIGTGFSPNAAYFNLSANLQAKSIAVANSTYAGISMRDGDGEGGFGKNFGGDTGSDPDWFRVTFTGFEQADVGGTSTGSVEFYLSDFRFADDALDYIVEDWQTVDLTGLGDARSIGITLDGSDVGPYGLNTPAYVAIDNLAVTAAVPEPSSMAMLSVALVAGGIAKRRRNKRQQKIQTS
ncbi:hypothetical protein EC9_19000 [Rosistilla ulvae]|uniref:Ice-binding protein C-terminal domain-containing protein n=1 Tax=Rosistilla ulvae TaxID=1930277 RepID=A0A517LYM6_9BACT|nr:DUF4465 domain-containing protein [Rosistilla ulvae]QDS87721.1 hypothetical protein EC9_19000 [Rosistilla ulvae]